MPSVVRSRMIAMVLLLAGLGLIVSAGRGQEQGKAKVDKAKEIAGKSEFLRSVPKHYAILTAIDPARRRVTLLIEGETLAKVWQLTADAEIKRAGWWARLDQLAIGDRVWCWFETDRSKQAVAVFMLCDELSEQDMHGPGLKLEARDTQQITVKDARGKSRTIPAEKAKVAAGKNVSKVDQLAIGEPVYVQTAGGGARLILDSETFENERQKQKNSLRQRWIDEGLPGSVAFLHRLTGEMELMLDHETMRWARSLQPGDSVTLAASPPIKGVVRQVKPWRERTQVRLVVTTFDQADLSPGQRIAMKMAAPPAEVDFGPLPPDIDRPRSSREERIDWFLASIYCTCKVGGDGCTGHFYTLASCNPNACGMPNLVRRTLASKIDKGLSDRQIYQELIDNQGPDLLRPHLLP